MNSVAVALARCLLTLGTVLLPITPATGQTVGPAPWGDPATVAYRIILINFDHVDCPQVVQAARIADGSIRAMCSNQEIFRVFTVDGQPIALRCSVMLWLGIPGC
jgi:hypothetical protein